MTLHGDDLHATAEKFLREYLLQTGSKAEHVELSAAASAARHVSASQAAKEFLKAHLKKTRHTQAHQQVEAEAITSVERYEIEEPKQVLLSRRSPRCVSYFCGFKRGLPIFTHDKALAMVIDAANRDELSRLLRERHNIETFVLPAPELRRGSF
jgi:hypothetical protein